jgi:hypothetical protein
LDYVTKSPVPGLDDIGKTLACPSFFGSESERRYKYDQTVDLGLQLTEAGFSETADNARSLYLQRLNLIPFYSIDGSLKELMTVRGSLLSMVYRRHRFLSTLGSNSNRQKHKILVFKPSLNTGPELASMVSHIFPTHPDFDVTVACQYVPEKGVLSALIKKGFKVCLVPQDLYLARDAIYNFQADLLLYATNQASVLNTATVLGVFRLCPIQIATTMSPVTTGLAEIDYYLTGRANERYGFTHRYSEMPLFISGDINLYNPEFLDSEDFESRQLKRDFKSEYFNIIVAGNLNKIGENSVRAWAEILSRVANSRLLVAPYNPNWQPSYDKSEFEGWFFNIAHSLGVSYERIQFIGPFKDRQKLLHEIAKCRLYLDTFPYSGAASIFDALRCGTPFITIDGEQARFRQASTQASHYPKLGAVAHSIDEYISKSIDQLNNQSHYHLDTSAIRDYLQSNVGAESLSSRVYEALKLVL